MKLIKHIILVDIGDGRNLMINSLYGLMDEVDSNTFEIVKKWQNQDMIAPDDNAELELYNSLKNRHYFVNSHDEELEKKKEILSTLKKRHENAKINSKHITFILTYDCNFRCPYCFEEASLKRATSKCQGGELYNKASVMTPELIDAAFNLVGDNLGSIGLFGGEPLLPKNRLAIEYIIKKAPDKIYNITSNGYYLEDFLDLLTKINISHIMVTLDGEEETHNGRRYLVGGGPTYHKIMDGIEKCLENNVPICIRMNLDYSNLEECKALKTNLLNKFSSYKGLLSFEVSPMKEASIEEKTRIFSELYAQDFEHSMEDRKQRNRLLSRFAPIVNAITTGDRLKPVFSYCFAHDNGYLVDPHGFIYPCLSSVGIEELAIGKYYPLVEFKENSIRNRNIGNIPKCKECEYSLLCGGGCPIRLASYENVLKPHCPSIRYQIHNILPLYYSAKDSTVL